MIVHGRYRKPETGETSVGRTAPRAGGPRCSARRYPASGISDPRHFPQSPIRHPKCKGGFTLLELLLSLTLIGMLLVAMNQFIFSMGELWGRGTDVRLFQRHVRAVTRFVDHTVGSTALPAATGVQALVVQEVKLPDGPTEALLTFELPEGSHVLPWPDTPLPDVVCALGWRRDQGLILYWHSRLETRFADDPPRATVLSPLVTGISYDYYNSNFNSWQNYTVPQRDGSSQWQLPTRLRLKFGYGRLTQETVITLPTASRALPLF
jgi:prepilin-type N-terminal cleavage/methylation domain-containing protein